jgi:uncharacterized membrane protein
VGTQTSRSRTIPLLIALVALALLWLMPDIETEAVDAGLQPREAWRAVVVDPAPPPPDPEDEFSGYGDIIVEVAEGPRTGELVRAFVALQTTSAVPADFAPGDEVVLTFAEDFDGSEMATVNEPYRLPVLGLLVLLFGAVMVLVGGWQGVRALVALGLTVVLVAKLFIPLILDGWAPVPLAIVMAALVTVTTILLTEGFTRVGAVAIAGTIGGLLITALLAALFNGAADFTNTSVGELVYVTFSSGATIDAGGVLLGAIILGAVGVLDDVTVTQAATVEEFAAKTGAGIRGLWQQAFRVGRSHIAATTNTLFMAYVGASLPALVFIVVVAEPTLLTLNREILALEVVRTLVGSIGIILAMPLTTFLAAVVFGQRMEPDGYDRD